MSGGFYCRDWGRCASHWWGEMLTPLDYVIEDLVDMRETRRDTFA